MSGATNQGAILNRLPVYPRVVQRSNDKMTTSDKTTMNCIFFIIHTALCEIYLNSVANHIRNPVWIQMYPLWFPCMGHGYCYSDTRKPFMIFWLSRVHIVLSWRETYWSGKQWQTTSSEWNISSISQGDVKIEPDGCSSSDSSSFPWKLYIV